MHPDAAPRALITIEWITKEPEYTICSFGLLKAYPFEVDADFAFRPKKYPVNRGTALIDIDFVVKDLGFFDHAPAGPG